ncbi:MAG: HEAT repeat domain-containing protein [Ignavibacteria bacterium]|nr:HEAT repeat domain-containing protein [Ignavibacteria bacterium]
MRLEFFILFTLALAALFFFVVASIALVVRKAIGVQRQRGAKRLYGLYSAQLAELLLTDLPVPLQSVKSPSVHQQYEALLTPTKRKLSQLTLGRKALHREALRSVLIDLAGDVVGEAAERLAYFFSSLGFVQDELILLRSKKWWIRAQAARHLGSLRARRAIPLLTVALEDKDPGVRYEAIQALVRVQGVESLSAILRVTRRLSRWRAIELSTIIMQFGSAAAPYLIKALKSPDQSIVLFSIEMLAAIGFVSAVEPLRALLQGYPSSVVQAKAAEALGRLGDERAEEGLLKLVGSPHPHLRLKAVEALGRIGSPAAIHVLLDHFARGHLGERIATARAIAALGPAGAETICSLAADEDELTRAVALQVAEEHSLDIGKG